MKVGRLVDGLKAAGVEFFAGVPDSSLKSFCTHETDCCVVKMLLHHFYSTNGVRPFGPSCGKNHVIVANESGAIGQ